MYIGLDLGSISHVNQHWTPSRKRYPWKKVSCQNIAATVGGFENCVAVWHLPRVPQNWTGHLYLIRGTMTWWCYCFLMWSWTCFISSKIKKNFFLYLSDLFYSCSVPESELDLNVVIFGQTTRTRALSAQVFINSLHFYIQSGPRTVPRHTFGSIPIHSWWWTRRYRTSISRIVSVQTSGRAETHTASSSSGDCEMPGEWLELLP